MCLTSFIPGITGNIIVESGTVLDDIVYYKSQFTKKDTQEISRKNRNV